MHPLPPDVIERFGYLPDHKYRGNHEHSSACPQCGGARGGRDLSDRFRMWERPGQCCSFWCRRCAYKGFTDDNQTTAPPTPERIKELEEIRQRETAREAVRLQTKIEQLRHDAYWQGYHDAMEENGRILWRNEGIDDRLQDYFKLGFVGQKRFYDGEDPFNTSALTIPHFDLGWLVTNIQFRMIRPPNGVGKYRYTKGLPAPLFLTDPDNEPEGATLLVEGAKKAIVLFAHVGHHFSAVIAVPSKMPSKELMQRLADCEPLYVCLDPDAYVPTKAKDGRILPPAVKRLSKMVSDRGRYVRPPAKPDDLFVKYGWGEREFMTYVGQAVREV